MGLLRSMTVIDRPSGPLVPSVPPLGRASALSSVHHPPAVPRSPRFHRHAGEWVLQALTHGQPVNRVFVPGGDYRTVTGTIRAATFRCATRWAV